MELDCFHILASKEFLGIKIFDTDLYKMVLLLGINFIMSFILIRLIYYPNSNRKKEYLFTFMLIGTIVFFLAFALKSFKFNTGKVILSLVDRIAVQREETTDAKAFIRVYPNPTMNSIHIEHLSQGLITIIDSNGKVVFRKRNTEVNTEINVQSFPEGYYFIRLNDESIGNFVKVN